MALVTLVVIGHAWTLLPSDGFVGTLYDYLYFWHMPAFVFVTGYLSRNFTYRPDRLRNLVRTVAVPYVVFECAMALFRVHVGGEDLEDLFADPHWPLWFLAALFCWRLLTPVFRPLYGGLLVAIGISLVAGIAAGDTLDLARVLGMLPFYVLGLKATPERLARLDDSVIRVVGLGVLAALTVLVVNWNTWASTEWLYYRSTYDQLGVDTAQGALVRLALLGIGVVAGLAFLSLVPHTGGWFARMGRWTLVVYLFHGFAIKGLSYTDYPVWAAAHPVTGFVATTLGAIALSLLLAAPGVARRLDRAVDPLGAVQQQVSAAVDLSVKAADPDAGPDVPRSAPPRTESVGR